MLLLIAFRSLFPFKREFGGALSPCLLMGCAFYQLVFVNGTLVKRESHSVAMKAVPGDVGYLVSKL